MRNIHSANLLHGDPHTGNFFVISEGCEEPFAWHEYRSLPHIPIKMLDLGSSLLWIKKENFEVRERKVIIETAERLVGESIHQIIELELLSDYKTVLYALEQWATYIFIREKRHHFYKQYSHDEIFMRAMSELAEAILNCPIFNLRSICSELDLPVSTNSRFLSRLLAGCIERNEKLNTFADVSAGISIEELEPHYIKLRSSYLSK